MRRFQRQEQAAGARHAEVAPEKSLAHEEALTARVLDAVDVGKARGPDEALRPDAEIDAASAPLLSLRHHDGLALVAAERQALCAVRERLERLRALVVRALWPATPGEARAELAVCVRDLVQELGALAGSTQFLGLRLLAGNYPMVGVQSTPGGAEFVVVVLLEATPQALGIAALDVERPARARAALRSIDSALDTIGSAQRVIAEDVRALLG